MNPFRHFIGIAFHLSPVVTPGAIDAARSRDDASVMMTGGERSRELAGTSPSSIGPRYYFGLDSFRLKAVE